MAENRVVLITGASRGIGKEVAKKFAENKYNLALNYASDKVDIESLKKEFEQYSVEVSFIKANVANFSECEDMVNRIIEKYGKIDVLVNNAGITKDNLLMRMKEQDFDDVINVNLKGTFNMTKNVVPFMMKKKYGKIVNVSSVVGIAGNAGQCNYSASKAGIIGFTKSMAKELASRNINVNAIAPGFIATDMTSVLSDSIKENINAQIPLKRMGTAKEVANLIYFLSSEQSDYITGQVIHVDGGMVM